MYPNGIKDVIKDKGPKENEPCIILICNCPKSFYKKYSNKDPSKNKFIGLKFFEDIVDKFQNILLGSDDYDYKEMSEIGSLSDEDRETEVKNRIKTTEAIKNLLLGTFENYESLNEDLLQAYIEEFESEKIELLRGQNLQAYRSLNAVYKRLNEDNNENYSYLDFEDYILIIVRIMKYYTDLKIKLDFTDLENQFTITFYGNEEKFNILAEKREYRLKLKNYALKFEKILENKKMTQKNIQFDEIIGESGGDQKLLRKEETKDYFSDSQYLPMKYNQIHIKNVLDFSPYMRYSRAKQDKFQRYELNDDYHECNMTNEEDDKCHHNKSKFRNIDKLRLIFGSIEDLLQIKFLTKNKILNYFLIKRNYIDYGDKLETRNIVFRSWNLFNKEKTMEFLFTVRNFYGEEISYYFLWLTSYIKWLIFPAGIGLLFNFLYRYLNFEDGTHNPVWPLLLSAIYIFWGTAFLFQWKQKELLYNYIWGVENYKRSEPDRETFVPDKQIILMFGQELPYVSKVKKFFKSFLSYTILFTMMIIVFVIVNYIFYAKSILIQKYPERVLPIGVLIAGINTAQITLMSSFYQKLAIYFNDLENHRKEYLSSNALAIKLIVYDFINCYYSIIFIGLIKKSTIFGKKPQKCYGYEGDDNCSEEIAVQLYTILFIRFVMNFWEIGQPILNQGAKLVELSQNLNILNTALSIKPHSIEHQMICTEYSMTIFEYNEMIINFGFVILFGAIAPLVAVYIFLLGYMEKFFDTYKIFFLERVQLLHECNGLEIFNTIIQVFIYLGLFSNIGFVIFGDNLILPNEAITTKIIIYAIYVFIVYMGTILLEWNILPPWFEYLSEIKELYYKKYYLRDEKYLPHKNLGKEKEEQKEKIY